MATSKKQNNIGGTIGNVIKLITVATPIVKSVIEKIPQKTDHISDEYVLVPKLCSKKFRLTLNQATEVLKSYGLKALPVQVPFEEAAVKYKDCSESQVVATNPKANVKVKPGEIVYVKYVPRQVIEESRRIFTASEQKKAEARIARLTERAKQKEQMKQTVDKVKLLTKEKEREKQKK